MLLKNHIKLLLEGNLNGLHRFEFLTLTGGWFYFWGKQKRWDEKVLIRINRENFTTEHQYRKLGEMGWNRLSTEDRIDAKFKKEGE